MGARRSDDPSPRAVYMRARRERLGSTTTSERLHMRARLRGMSAGDLEMQFAAQSGGCAICKTSITLDRGSYLDHDHTTGAARGLLCHLCNLLLAAIDRDLENGVDPIHRLERAVAYARSSGTWGTLWRAEP
jgi:hypothetical protein